MNRLLDQLRTYPPDLVAGVPAVLAAVLAYGLGAPPWVDLVTAVAVFGGVRLALMVNPAAFARIESAEIKGAGDDLVREVTSDARTEMHKLLAAATAVREPIVRAHLMNFYTLGSKVIGEVERQPMRLGSVRRLLTYYLPSASRLGEGYQVLETARTPDAARLAATGTMIKRLYETCARQADRLNETDVDGLDIELKLLGDALGEEERTRPALPAPGPSPLGTPLGDTLPHETEPVPAGKATDRGQGF